MSEEEMRKLISKAAQHLLDNWDTLVAPEIPKITKDIKELISLSKSGEYTQEELLKLADEKASKFGKKEV